MSTYSISYYGELAKITFQLSSNMYLICFADAGSVDIGQKPLNLRDKENIDRL